MAGKKLNVVEKFNRFFTKLDPTEKRHLYDLMSVIRGPDAGDDKDTVKYAITCKIRGLLGVSGCNFIPSVDLGHERHTSPMIDHNAIDPATAKSQLNVFNNEHFVDHATDALSSLYELGILKEPVDEQHGTAP